VYIEKVRSSRFFKVNTWWDAGMFLHSTSVGKCLLPGCLNTEIEAMVQAAGTEKRTPKHHIDYETRRPGPVKHSGHAVDDEEEQFGGAACLGAPIFDAMGNVTAALGASGTLTQTDEPDMRASSKR